MLELIGSGGGGATLTRFTRFGIPGSAPGLAVLSGVKHSPRNTAPFIQNGQSTSTGAATWLPALQAVTSMGTRCVVRGVLFFIYERETQGLPGRPRCKALAP
jgi:hypothetical protein